MLGTRARPLRVALPLLAWAGASAAPHAHHAGGDVDWRARAAAWEPYLGHYAFNITTSSAEAQKLFGVGLLLIYNFDQVNARSAFQAALAADPECAMCSWGLAYACGPFLNRPMKTPEELAMGLAAARNASQLVARRPTAYSAKERAFVASVAVRFPEEPTSDFKAQTAAYRRYAAELRRLREADASLRDDADLTVFDAEAVMILMCDKDGIYSFYKGHGDAAPATEAPAAREARGLLKASLARTNQTHPYAHHLLIHVTEMSNERSEDTVASAFRLQKEMADLQNNHLQHMTSHTFMRTGHYHAAVVGGSRAVATEAAWMRHDLLPNSPAHDTAFTVEAAMFGGERAAAYRYVKVLQSFLATHPTVVDEPDATQAWALPMQVALRFGDWGLVESLDAEPPKGFAERWPYGYGVVRHFARGVAAQRLGRPAVAREHLEALRGLAPAVAATRNAVLANLTAIANHTLAAVIAHAQGDVSEAAEALSRAADQEMAIPYRQPPDWPTPSRECQGQALLDAGRPAEAERVFRTALYGHSFHSEPDCGWALAGLRTSLLRQSATSARRREIQELDGRIREAWRHADVELRSPCLLLAGGPQSPILV